MPVNKIFNNQFSETVGILFILAVSSFLLALIATDLLSLRFFKPYKMVVPEVKAAKVTPPKSVEFYINALSPVFRTSLNGSDPAGAASLETISPEFPKDIQLEATVIGDTSSIAMIRSSGESKIYAIGDIVAPPMKLLEIESDRVRLVSDNSGITMVLHLKYGFSFEDEIPPPLLNGDSGGVSSFSTSSSSTIEVSKREFEALLDPPSRIASEVSLAPIAKNGSPYGIRMSFVKPGSFVEKMGFRRGDILLSMNNKQLLTPEDGMMAYQTMKNEDSVDFKIDRGGTVMNVHINFK